MIHWVRDVWCCRRRLGGTRPSFTSDDTCDAHPPRALRDPTVPFSDLPVDLQQAVVKFLSPQEALRVCQTSKTIRAGVALKHRQPFRILEEWNWFDQPESGAVPGSPQIATIIPIFGTSVRRVHSVVVVCEWCDLGRTVGNRKSQLFIVAHGADDDDLSLSGGTIIAESGFAPLTISKLIMSFRPTLDEVYYLWYTMGGVQLYIRNVWVYQLVFDDRPN